MSGLPAVLVGLVSGVLSGMFGIGGGLVTTPSIRLVLGYPALVAVGTPLVAIVPTAVAGAATYARAGLADVRRGLAIGAWGIPASVAGAALTRLTGGGPVMLATAALILYVSGEMLVRPLRGQAAGSGVAKPAEEDRRGAWIIGLVAGAYSGFLGLGGGFVIVPLLLRRGVPMKCAIGTSLVGISLLAVPGIIVHSLLGHVDWTLGAALALGSVPGALVGARVTRAVSESWVRVGFALLLGATGAWLAIGEFAGFLR
ncbi:MAG: hypothetical protein C0418_02720 [Coriobacteriaceae bacterium]|nr:hypothetical protein [Coriobacteriaceae bacterium]